MTPEEVMLAMGEELLAPGVCGHRIESDGAIYFPTIAALRPSNGDVSRFLDALPKDQTIKFPCVLSQKFLGMLQRRGFTLTLEHSDEFDEDVEVWVRAAVTGEEPKK